MAYIGRSPSFGTYEKQTITPDGSTTTFSLDFGVGTTSSILVFVNDTIQEPSVDYTLSNGGSDIVFTSAPAGGATVFLIFLGKQVDNPNNITVSSITAQTELTSGLDATDEFLINDGGVLKRMDVSVLTDYYNPLTVSLTNKSIDLTNNTLTGTTAQFNSALSDGSFVTLNGTETVTNKTIDSANNTLTLDLGEGTLTGTFAEFNSAVQDATLISTSSTSTLTNKTISGSNNTLSDIGNGSLTNSSITVAGDSGSDGVSLGETFTIAGGTGIDTTGSSNTVTIATAQDISTSASPTFAGLTSTGNIDLGDSDRLRFGASNDLQIYHNGSKSLIYDSGAGDLEIRATNFLVADSDGTSLIYAQDNAEVNLYHNGSNKFQTTSGGVNVTGTITFDGGTTSADLNFGDNDKAKFGASSDLQIYHDGANSIIADKGTGHLLLTAPTFRLRNDAQTEEMINADENGAVKLYYDGSQKLATTTGGIDITGTVTADGATFDGLVSFTSNASFLDNDKALFGSSNDFQIYHDGTDSIIEDVGTGELEIRSNGTGILLQKATTEYLARFLTDGASELYYDNSKKFETTSTGATISGDLLITEGTPQIKFTDTDNNADAYIQGSDGNLKFFADDGQESGSSNISFSVDGSEKVRIDNSGKVGIGETSPDGFLVIKGNSNDSTDPSIRLKDGTDSREAIVTNQSGDLVLATMNSSDNVVDSAVRIYTAQMIFQVSGTNAMTIDGSQNAIFDYGVLANEGTLTDGATIAWDVNTTPVAKVTLGGNRTISAPSNQAGSGQFISILVIQDGTGSRTLTWNAAYEFKDDTAPTLTTTGGKGDLFVFRYYGTGSKWVEVGRNLNLSLS